MNFFNSIVGLLNKCHGQQQHTDRLSVDADSYTTVWGSHPNVSYCFRNYSCPRCYHHSVSCHSNYCRLSMCWRGMRHGPSDLISNNCCCYPKHSRNDPNPRQHFLCWHSLLFAMVENGLPSFRDSLQLGTV